MSDVTGILNQPKPEQEPQGAGEQRRRSPRPHRAPAPLSNAHPEADTANEAAQAAPTRWQDTLWHEWRNTNDAEYAGHLFTLIGSQPVGQLATLAGALSGTFYGGLTGLLVGLLSTLGSSPAGVATLLAAVGLGVVLGGVAGFLTRRVGPPLTWQDWLARVTLNVAPNELGLMLAALVVALFGSQIGWMLSWSAGLGHSVGIISLSILLTTVLGVKLVGWLIRLKRAPNPNHLHQYRRLWVWWRQRPHSVDVEAALRQACQTGPKTAPMWADILQSLNRHKNTPPPFEALIPQLQSRNWAERFTAAHLLAASGGEGIRHLLPVAQKITSPLRPTAIRLLHAIARETETRLAHRTQQVLCPHCLTFFGSHAVQIDGTQITYYGCRTCGQSRKLWPGRVVALLDNTDGDPLRQNTSVRVNWLVRRELFDFHRVEIVQATDEEVERFAVQVGNDTDPFRRSHYRQMRCLINPDCRLSENTRRILQRMFGHVEPLINSIPQKPAAELRQQKRRQGENKLNAYHHRPNRLSSGSG